MRFGTHVMIQRGGGAPKGTPGCYRLIEGLLVGARGNERWVKLLEDDPLDTVGWSKAGQIGHWSKSALVTLPYWPPPAPRKGMHAR
jgi:hypothetical protein